MISESNLEQFRTSLRGQLILSNQPEYDEVRKIFNGMIDRRPAMILRCAGIANVINAVHFAPNQNLEWLCVRRGIMSRESAYAMTVL